MLVKTANEWELILMAMGCQASVATKWAPIFAEVIDNENEFSQGEAELPDFLANILHESGMLRSIKESGFYSAQRIRELAAQAGPGTRWRSLGPIADSIARNEAKFFEACYGGRLGNDQPGDGAKYPGRGVVMVTGKWNYAELARVTGLPLVEHPEYLEDPRYALHASILWWEGKVPDVIMGDVKKVRQAVNGGTIGLDEVRRLYNLAVQVLSR